jgi:thiamine-monophosphate kinase
MKVDMLVQRTDMPRQMTFRQAARKSVAMCVSDFASKGAKPDSFMVSLGLKRGTSQEQIDELAKGLRDAEDHWSVRLVGGDTNEAGELIIDCIMVGSAERIVPRDGTKAGDIVVVTGLFGLPPAGLLILDKGAFASESFRERATESVLSPTPNLRVGLALAPYLTSGLDSSDGLARSLHILAEMSGVGIDLDTLPTDYGIERFARDNGLEKKRLVLAGGEEYLIVGTLKPSNLESATVAVRKAGGKLITIGKVTRDRRMVALRKGGVREPIADEGWTHLG